MPPKRPSASDSDGSRSKNPRGPWRTWPAADEIALLEAVDAHLASHDRLPTPEDLLAALRGRLQTEGRDAEDFARRMRALRARYDEAARRLSRGAVPVKDDDVRIYQLSKLVWGGWRQRAARTTFGGEGQPKRARNIPREQTREFGELAWLYPTLAWEVETLEVKQPCGGLLKRAFGRIGDEKARELEGKVKKQRLVEFKMRMKAEEMRKEVTVALLELID